MLKNGVAIRRSRHHWFFGLRPATGGKIPTTHFFAQAQVTLLSTLQRGAGSGARKENGRTFPAPLCEAFDDGSVEWLRWRFLPAEEEFGLFWQAR